MDDAWDCFREAAAAGPAEAPSLTMDDAWDCFGGAAAELVAASEPLLQRASAHPHFMCCAGLWPAYVGTVSDEAQRAETSLRESNHAPCVASLRASKGVYGRDAASALSRAHSAFGSLNATRSADQGRALADLCAEQLEEGDWDDPCWQEATLLGLAYQLIHVCSSQLFIPLSVCSPPLNSMQAVSQHTTGGEVN